MLQITEPLRGRNDTRRNLVGLSRADLKTALTEAGLEPFRMQQIWQWIYWHGVTDFGRMTNIAKKTRDRLAELFVIERPQIVTHDLHPPGAGAFQPTRHHHQARLAGPRRPHHGRDLAGGDFQGNAAQDIDHAGIACHVEVDVA